MREPWQEPKRSGELRGKEIGGLPWKEFVEKYPHLEKKLQSMKCLGERYAGKNER
jgi:hypothetical protein